MSASGFYDSLIILKIRDYRNFVVGRFFLTLAIQMQMTTIGLQVYYQEKENPFVLGLLGFIGLFEAIPFVITSFFSGHLADTISRKKIILFGIGALLFGSSLLCIYSLKPLHLLSLYGIIPLFFIVSLFGVIRAFLAASIPAFMSQLVERNLYTSAATWNSTVWHIGSIIGPLLAAWIFGFNNALNADVTYAVNCFLFLFALISFALIEKKPLPVKEKKEKVMESLKAGLNFVFKSKMLLSALSLDLFAVLFGGAVAILPAFNDKILHASAEQFGLLRTAPAIGAVIMAIILLVKPPGKKAGKALLWSVAGFGLATIAFAFCTDYWLAFMALLLTGAFDNVSVVIRHSILQLMTPDHMRGRVSAVNSIFIGSSNEIGGFESGIAAQFMGLVRSIVFGGCMTIVVVFSLHKLNPKLKSLDLKKME